jgi:diguanylate cyclase (GGDEF)-like protein
VDSFARRPLDIAARYGGEEFALVLYDAPESVVNGFAEELRVAVERARIEHERSFAVPVMTVSVGVALFHPASSGHACDEAVQLVDKALYTAKRLGRNRVSILRPTMRSTDTLAQIAASIRARATR